MRTPNDRPWHPTEPDTLEDFRVGWEDGYAEEQIHRHAMHREDERARERLRAARGNRD